MRGGGDNVPVVLSNFRLATRANRALPHADETERSARAPSLTRVVAAAAFLAGIALPRVSLAANVSTMLESALRIVETNYLFAEELDAGRLLGGALEFVEAAIPQVQARGANGPGYVIEAGDCELHAEVRAGASLRELVTPLAAVSELIRLCVSELPKDLPSPVTLLLNGLFHELDPYSVVFDGRGKTEHTIQFRGKLAGIGARIGTRRDALTLITVYAGSPAARAGLRDKDRVLRIDGVSTVNMPVSDAVERIRGDVGTDVVLTIARDEETDPIAITVTRGLVTIPSVEARVLESGNIYAAISHFSQTTPEDFRGRVEALMGADRGRGVIIDLRGNSGGSMLGSSAIADTFLDEGLLITTAGRHGSHVSGLTDEVRATGTTPFRNSPVVILTSSRTASGSELMAASLRNNDRAIFVGQRSFGKGTVQKTYALGTDQALKLTVGNFLPKGLAIPAGGLVPDVEIRTLLLSNSGYRIPLRRDAEEDMKFWQRNPPWLTVEPARTPVVLSFLRDVAQDDDGHPDEEEEVEETLPEDPLADPAIAVADDVLTRFGSTSASRMMADASVFLAERSRQADADLASALAEKGIDWNDAAAGTTAAEDGRAAPAVRVEINPDSRVLRAGVEETLDLRITNPGPRPLYRVLAALDSEIGFFRGIGTLVGRLEPNATVTRSITIKPPIELRMARLPVEVIVEDGSGVLGRHGPYSIVVEETDRPILAHRADVSQGEAADVVELHVQITNRGKADSGEIRLQLQQPEAGIAELLEGTTTFPPLAPDASVDTRLHVKLLTSAAEAPLVNLSIVDTVFRSFSESKIRLIETEGDWREPPSVTLSRFESRDDDERLKHSIVVSVTDDKGIAQLRASVDGDRVAFVDLSARPATSRTVELPWTPNGEAKRYEIVATDADGLVTRYVTEL